MAVELADGCHQASFCLVSAGVCYSVCDGHHHGERFYGYSDMLMSTQRVLSFGDSEGNCTEKLSPRQKKHLVCMSSAGCAGCFCQLYFFLLIIQCSALGAIQM